jgi:hypothetical protein
MAIYVGIENITMYMVQKVMPLAYVIATISMCGRDSIAKVRHERLNRICHADGRITEISEKLGDIERVM